MESAGRIEKIWKKSAPQDHQHEHDRHGNGQSILSYDSPQTSPGQRIAHRATEARQGSSEILSNHIESPPPSDTGPPSMSAHLWRAGEAGVVESAQSTATNRGGANATGTNTGTADDMQGGDGASGHPRTPSAEADISTSASALRPGMSVVRTQTEVPQVPSAGDVVDSDSNLQILRWGQQVRRRKDLVPKLHSLRERRSLSSDKAGEIRQSQDQNSARISELEKHLQNARRYAGELTEQYEASKLEERDMSVVIGNMEGEIEKIDQELLQP
ncbi:hypothetical protein LTR62_001942 [Meristemomyces frigidus]|uniref:Uncharacterized protein n=1 Tax=Meristemomyces frigidus TaxID=1508187 RepID=A0AAN7YM57_9PEZI|nr:hypothetical protein LTR62_001942 [Meristemomyces frigidus]